MSLYPEIVITGCGNPLFADDGFGPAVIEELKKITLPGNVKTVDAGTGAPDLIFTLLDPLTTKKIIVIDIVDFGSKPGDVIKFQPGELFPENIKDTGHGEIVQSLQALKSRFDVTIIGCQPKNVPFPFMEIGLSREVKDAIAPVVKIILGLIGVDYCSLCCFNCSFGIARKKKQAWATQICSFGNIRSGECHV